MASTQAAETLVVFSTSKQEEVSIRTLVGDYVEVGSNRGRKTYQKTERILGMEEMDVFLYYWEDEEAVEWCGWWFGDEVGGAKVWSRHSSRAQKPPKTGWNIPWDGPVKNQLCVMNKAQKQAEERNVAKGALLQARQGGNARPTARPVLSKAPVEIEVEDDVEDSNNNWEARLDEAANRTAEVEVDARQAMDFIKALEHPGETEISKAQADLLKHQKAVTTVQKFVSAETLAAKAAPAHLKQDLQNAASRMRKLQADLKEALLSLQKLRAASEVKAEVEEKIEEVEFEPNPLESEHLQQLEEMLPAVNEKIQTAEDEVEKVTIAAAPLQVESGEELRPVMLQAIKDTEKAVRAAQAAIGEARRFISGKMSQIARFAGASRQQAIDEFGHLQEKLNEAQKRLNPLKSARQDYEKRAQVRKLHEELSNKLASAEIEVEKAAMMTAPMGFDNQDSVKETETALAMAQSMLAQTNRQVESKLRGEKDAALTVQFKDLLERCKMGQEKLDEVRKSLRETQVRMAADLLMKEVSDKVAHAEDEIQKMAEAELPFLRSDKDQDLSTLFAEADKVSVQVHGVLAETQSFVARKMVEVAKFSEGPGQAVKEEVEMLQKRLEEGRERLQQFRSSIADRKRTHLLEEVEVKVVSAEDEVKRMSDVASLLPSLGKAGENLSEQLTELLEQANQAERAAQASVVTARKFLLQKTADLKKLAMAGASGGSGSELGRLQTRVNGMQQEVAKLRNNISSAEERQRVKQQLVEVMEKLQMVEAEVEKVAANAIPDQEYSAEQLQGIEKGNNSAKMKSEQLGKLMDIKLKSASGFMQEELSALRFRLNKAEKKLEKVIQNANEQKERLLAAELIAQSLEQVDISEGELRKASQAELAFLKGFEVELSEMETAIADCEAAASTTKKAISQARSCTMENLAKVKTFTENVADGCTKELIALQKRLDQMAAKLTTLNKETSERKRKVQLQTIKEKISSVEEAVKKFEEKVKSLSDAEALLKLANSEAAIARFKEASECEDAAKVLIDQTKKLLIKTTSDAKTLSESQRAPFVTEMGKLQSRLTPVQVQFKKLSVDCTNAEHGYVAHSLSKEVEGNLLRLSEQSEMISQACNALLEDNGHNKVMTVLRRDALVDILQEQLKSVKVEELWEELAAGADAVGADDFGARLQTRLAAMPFGACITQEHLKAIWSELTRDSQMNEVDFKALLRESRVVLQNALLWDAPEGGRQVSEIYMGEHLQVVEDHQGERLHCRVLRDGRSLWVEGLKGAEGREVLGPVPAEGRNRSKVSQLLSLQTYIKALAAECGQSASDCEQKAAKVANVAATSKLLPARNKLLEAVKKLRQEKGKLDGLLERFTAAKDAAEEKYHSEVKELEDAKSKVYAEESISQAKGHVKHAEDAVEEVVEACKTPEELKDMTPSELEVLMKQSADAIEILERAQATLKETDVAFAEDRVSRGARRFMLQVRVALTRLKGVLKSANERGNQCHESISGIYQQVKRKAVTRARNALRCCFRQSGVPPDSAFQQISRANEQITKDDFLQFASKLPTGSNGVTVTQTEAATVFEEFAKGGMYKINFLKAVQEYGVCIKEVTMTSSFSIDNSQKIRKLLKNENVEILEGPNEDAEAKVARVRCRALKDGTVGWVTIKGNQGTAFLRPREKPLIYAVANVDLREDSTALDAGGGSRVRVVQVDEKLELLEGPREVTVPDQIFLEGCTVATDGFAPHDGDAARSSDGYVAMEALEKSGTSCSTRHFVCKSTIAMTDVYDISNCKVVGKVQVDDVLELLDHENGDVSDEEGLAIPRRRFRSTRLGKEGWVTLTGNAGTVYLVQSDKHYVLQSSGVPLLATPERDALQRRELQAGELFCAKKEVKLTHPLQVQMQARALSDEKVGWITFQQGPNAPVTSSAPKP